MAVEDSVQERRAARVVLVDGRNRVLLFRGCDPRHPDDKFWFTAGGGVLPGETDRQAACRELFEETGIRCRPEELTGPIHESDDEFDFDGRRIRQHQVFFRLRVIDAIIDVSGFNETEKMTMDRHAWWDGSQLRATRERFYPMNLPELLDGAPWRSR